MGDVVAVDHDGRERHAALLGDGHRIERIDEGRLTAFLKGFDHLHDELLAALQHRHRLGHVEPRGRGMTAAARVVAHVGRTTKASQAAARDGGRMPIAIHLQRRADEEVHRVLASQLAQHAVRTQRAITAGEEHIRARGHVAFHAQLGAEAMHAFHPA